MVHFKPKMQWTDELHKLEELLRPRIGENPLFDATPWFPLHVLTAIATRDMPADRSPSA